MKKIIAGLAIALVLVSSSAVAAVKGTDTAQQESTYKSVSCDPRPGG